MTFTERLQAARGVNNSWLMIGLDPVLERLPDGIARDAGGFLEFNRRLIDATHDLVIGYKLNFAFYEALGAAGWGALIQTRHAIPAGLLAMADAKRGDIGDTAELYAKSIFDEMDFDAVTLSPYVGREGAQPFLDRSSRGSFVLCRTSNRDPVPQEIQTSEGRLYEVIAREVPRWGPNTGLVVGATDLQALSLVRGLAPRTPFLVPGIGSQGGILADAVARSVDAQGGNAIIPISRAIQYASSGEDFADAAGKRAREFATAIQKAGDSAANVRPW